MDAKEKAIRQRLKNDYSHYASKCLWIRTKSASIQPLILNNAQNYIHARVEQQLKETGKVRALVLKGRQQGVSTYIAGRFFHKCTHKCGVRVFILTHEEDATRNLFEMAKRYHENCPELVRPSTLASNAKELVFGEIDSGYKLGTAGNKAAGRSSTIQYLHGSEVAYWPHANEHAQGILQAVPDQEATEVFLESTANGVGNYFHQQWQLAEAGISDFIAIFVPWYWQEEYTREINDTFTPEEDEIQLQQLYGLSLEQLAWRRYKIIELSANGMDGTKAFKQEYPCNATEAFQVTGEDTFIAPNIVMAARKAQAEPYGSLLIGVDPARFGDDRTSIIRRQGRVAFACESYTKKDTMEIVGIVHQIIEKEHPRYVFVDVGGLGAGIVDRLFELGHRGIVIPVNAGAKPLDANKFSNKRAEMWGLCREWLNDVPCQIPDIDSLHADLCGIKYKIDSNSRLKMEAKEDMKRRGLRSSDEADALCLTFAYPDSVLQKDDQRSNKIASIVTEKLRAINKIKGYDNHIRWPDKSPFG